MSKQFLLRWAVLPCATLAAAALAATTLAAEPGPEAARLNCFTHPDGTTYFALSLQPPATARVAGPRDVVVVVSTAAGEKDEYRAKELEALQAAVAHLGPEDRVQLIASDLTAVPLTNGFVAPNGAEWNAATAALNGRTPLGSSDMEKALSTAARSFGGAGHARALLYIGDGSSRANLLSVEKFQQLAASLADQRIPVSGYAVGPNVDKNLLGSLAAQTGGVVMDDKPGVSAAQAGEALAAAANATVVWPGAVKWPPQIAEVFPKTLPPLRSDRDTVVVGTLKGKDALRIEAPVEGPGGRQTLAWNVAAAKSSDDNNYLGTLVEAARKAGGVNLPLVGSASLEDARREIEAGGRGLTLVARQALASGNVDAADRLAGEALRRDPGDPEAMTIQRAAAKKRAAGGAAVEVAALPVPPPPTPQGPVPGAANPAAPVPPAPAPAGDSLNLVGDGVPPGVGGPGEADAAESFGREKRANQTIAQTEVLNIISQARGQMGANPQLAIQNLRMELEKIKQLSDLSPEARDQIVSGLQAALREGARRLTDFEHRQQEKQERESAAREQELLVQNFVRGQQRLKQVMDRFDSLMLEGRYQNDGVNLGAEGLAAEAEKLAPGSSVPVAARKTAELGGNYYAAMAMRDDADKGFIDMMFTVDLSHIGFNDNKPIVYPDAERWKELTKERKDRYSSMDLAKRGPAEKKINEALKSPTQLEFIDTPLTDVIDYLKDYHNIEIQLDRHAMEEAQIALDTPVKKNLKGISLKSALRLMLSELGLTYIIQDEVLLITTKEAAEQKLTTKVYPVADLVLPIRTPSAQGMMGGMGGGMGGAGGMMGGGGGGMGGMMGGGGGGMGGMGGGGGGMGGMMGGGGGGMGGGGGGFFSVPAETVPAKTDKPAADAPATIAAGVPANAPATGGKAAANRPTKIEVKIAPDAKPNDVWEKYFAANEPDPAAVRQEVRSLMSRQKFDHVIALIEAAIRHKQAQSWMYEAMALAMQAADRPKEQIERAVMSAVEFVGNTGDLLHLGLYLTELGLDQRALQVFRQVASLEPLRPEPYVAGMRIAQGLHDLEGIQWATLGVLSQGWPASQNEIWKSARRVALATLEKLRAEKRTKEAAQFEASMRAALERDCVINVRWTGDADVDLLVEEPTGSVCSLRNLRTNSGGVLCGDLFAAEAGGSGAAQGHNQIYVCPKGFSGTYKLLARRVWGQVITGKVIVEVVLHYNTPKAKRICQKVALEKGQAMVKFDLADGRRKEKLQDQQVANAALGQQILAQQVGQQVLAQQIGALVDPNAVNAAANSNNANAALANAGATTTQPLLVPYFPAGAVGYEPVIIFIPEGAQFWATAVVSADRRYVRITSVPFFSAIEKVTTFNYSSGLSTTQTGGGTGGQGYGQLQSGATGGVGAGVQ